MTAFHFQTHVSDSGMIALPPLPEVFYGENVTVQVAVKDHSLDDDWQPDPARVLPNGKTTVEDFLDFCKGLNLPSLTDEEVEQVKFDALMEKYG